MVTKSQEWLFVLYHSQGESVVRSDSTCSQKPKWSTTERGHQKNGWLLYARFCARPETSPESNSVQTLQNSFSWDYKLRSPRYIYIPGCKCFKQDRYRLARLGCFAGVGNVSYLSVPKFFLSDHWQKAISYSLQLTTDSISTSTIGFFNIIL